LPKGRAPSPPTLDLDLVGVTEIAKRAGVASINVVYMWRKRHTSFPPPLLELAMGPIWQWRDVEAWLAIPRPGGRPRNTPLRTVTPPPDAKKVVVSEEAGGPDPGD
jgi:hypothetical protein